MSAQFKRLTLTLVCKAEDVEEIEQLLGEALDEIHQSAPIFSETFSLGNARKPSDYFWLDELKD